MTYRIRRLKFNVWVYFAGNVDKNSNHWVLDINDSNLYLDKDLAKEHIKKYNLKGVEIYEEE